MVLSPLNREEIARYLGYGSKTPDSRVSDLIDRCEAAVIQTAAPRFLYVVKDLSFSEKGVAVEGTNLLLTGKDIAVHLADCKKAALFCATLSGGIDKLLSRAQLEDMACGVVMDCCASSAVEQVCDRVEAMVKEQFPGCAFPFRFSPGYGDLPISLQRELLNLLDAPRKIGLCVTESNMLAPMKSVTAILGIAPPQGSDAAGGKAEGRKTLCGNRCESCNLRSNCRFRKEGTENGF